MDRRWETGLGGAGRRRGRGRRDSRSGRGLERDGPCEGTAQPQLGVKPKFPGRQLGTGRWPGAWSHMSLLLGKLTQGLA